MTRARNSGGCIFCRKADRAALVATSRYAYAIRDAYPVTDGHVLIIPKRHVADFFEMTAAERSGVLGLMGRVRRKLLSRDGRIEGFNIGVNCGVVAGQTVMHCHLHLIPRRKGDTKDPRGGIRNLIDSSNNGKYLWHAASRAQATREGGAQSGSERSTLSKLCRRCGESGIVHG